MKGLCCLAQQNGDLGKPLSVTVTRKDGSSFQRCGVCEVRPSCSNPSKLVFAFRFLKGAACGLLGGSKCGPTPQGVQQYNTARSSAPQGPQIVYSDLPSLPMLNPQPAGRIGYTLPPS